MTQEKFIYDAKTALKFIECYCDNKHSEIQKEEQTLRLNYKNKDLDEEIHYKLCKNCIDTFNYSYKKLQNCPHDIKPSCRKCPKPCYEKQSWKHLAQIMKFSGMRLGILKIRKKILSKFKNGA